MATDPESLLSIVSAPRGIDISFELGLIRSGALAYDRLGGRGDEYIYFQRDAVVEGYTTAEATTHWYRGMSKQEFDQLFKFNMIDHSPNTYTGIAPNREYVKRGYFNNGSDGTHIVEFGPTSNLSLDEDFSVYRAFHNRGFSIKAEGGGTFGLGDTGSSSPLQATAVRNFGTAAANARRGAPELTSAELDALKTPADLFTEWLMTGKIYRRLVNLRLDAKRTARQVIES